MFEFLKFQTFPKPVRACRLSDCHLLFGIYLGFVHAAWILFFFLVLPVAALTGQDLQKKIGQMIMVGFSGVNLPETLVNDIEEYNLGGVVLFSHNIQNPLQIKNLTAAINRQASIPLLISVDQEGGFVARLRKDNGFDDTYSAYQLGTVFHSEDSTRAAAAKMARWLQESGINMNLAPVVDVNINPESPAIGYWQRSFSSDPMTVFHHAAWFIDEFHQQNIVTTLKHFPGHGSAKADSHKGFTDITQTWSDSELIPYQKLFENGFADVVMIGHLFNANMDSLYPASLSQATITGLLREKLGFWGVVMSDEMFMRAITDNYAFDEAIELAINSGTDILLYRTNLRNGGSLVSEVANIILQKVAEGKISESRIEESYQRIMALKSKWLHYTLVEKYRPAGPTPEKYAISNYPNPFNASTNILVQMNQSALVRIRILDITGREIALLADKRLPAGMHKFKFNSINLPSGLYFVRLETSEKTITGKITLVK